MLKKPYFLLLFLGVFALAGSAVGAAPANAAILEQSAGTGYVALGQNYYTLDSAGNMTSLETLLFPLPPSFPLITSSSASGGNRAWAIYPRRKDSAPLTNTDCNRFSINTNYGGGSSGSEPMVVNSTGDGCITESTYGFYASNADGSPYKNMSAYASSNYSLYEINVGAFKMCNVRNDCNTSAPVVVPPDYSSRIDSMTISSSTQTVNITGYWSHSSSTVYDTLYLSQHSLHLPTETIPFFNTNGELVATSTGAFNFTFAYRPLPNYSVTASSSVPIQDTLTINATLFHVDKSTYQCDSIFPIANNDGTITNCDPNSKQVADTSTATIYDGTIGYSDVSTSRGLSTLPEFECSIASMSGCLKNAFVWLFYPAADTVAQFNNLTLSNRFPFAYAYQVNDIRNALFNTTQTASSTISVSTPIGNMTFLSAASMASVPFAGLIKTLLSAVMWFMAVMVIYRRILASHDNQTQS